MKSRSRGQDRAAVIRSSKAVALPPANRPHRLLGLRASRLAPICGQIEGIRYPLRDWRRRRNRRCRDASWARAMHSARARELLGVLSGSKQAETSKTAAADEPRVLPRPCRCCGGRMIIIETFARGCQPKHRPAPAAAAIRIDTS